MTAFNFGYSGNMSISFGRKHSNNSTVVTAVEEDGFLAKYILYLAYENIHITCKDLQSTEEETKAKMRRLMSNWQARNKSY